MTAKLKEAGERSVGRLMKLDGDFLAEAVNRKWVAI